MQNILVKMGIILGVSSTSAFVSSTSIAMLVGFLVYNVIAGHGYVFEIANEKFFMAAIFVWPIGLTGGIISGLAGWLTAKNMPDVNKRIVKWSAIGGLLVALLPACFVGINTIA